MFPDVVFDTGLVKEKKKQVDHESVCESVSVKTVH